MHLFGDPDFPRQNLGKGAVLLALTSFLLGMTVNELFTRPAWALGYINLVIWVVLLFFAAMGFRLGLDSVPPDPRNHE